MSVTDDKNEVSANMAEIIKPPTPIQTRPGVPSIFLAGSIEMGCAEDWQTHFIDAFAATDVTIFNPRRDEWDSSWEQSINNPVFREQVEWELAGLEAASVIAMYFDPRTRAPVTLLELGLNAASGRLVVGCPDGFWRKGNVEIVCHRYDIPLLASLDDLAATVREPLQPA